MSEESREVLKIILEFLGPIAVIVVGALFERSRRVERAEKEAAKKNQEREKQELEDKLQKLSDRVTSLQNDISELKDQNTMMQRSIESMGKMDVDIQKDLHLLREYHERITLQVNTLANVVIVLSEGMRDNHIDGNVTRAVAAYKEFESKQLTGLLATPPIHDIKNGEAR